MAAPLSKLPKKSQEFLWEEEQETAFRNLKEAITSQPVLQKTNYRQKMPRCQK